MFHRRTPRRSTSCSSSNVHPQSPQVGLSFDDPVPSDPFLFLDTSIGNDTDVALPSLHSTEREVLRCLLAEPGLKFASLTVRRLPDGICLEGTLEASDGTCVEEVARQVAGVSKVLNRLVCRPCEQAAEPPRD
ncbi:MAG: BON domain-containing protein [Planctomycetaceae bacterium]